MERFKESERTQATRLRQSGLSLCFRYEAWSESHNCQDGEEIECGFVCCCG